MAVELSQSSIQADLGSIGLGGSGLRSRGSLVTGGAGCDDCAISIGRGCAVAMRSFYVRAALRFGDPDRFRSDGR